MGQESVLARGGKFVGEQVFTDVYWDTQGCGLTERDWWLRTRSGRWELKASVCGNLEPEKMPVSWYPVSWHRVRWYWRR